MLNLDKRTLSRSRKIITTSTAEAAKLAQNDRNVYCIANLYAADLFGLVNHISDIQDTKITGQGF